MAQNKVHTQKHTHTHSNTRTQIHTLTHFLSHAAGYYMYIETSRPRQDGDKARLLTPTFNSNAKSSASVSNSPAYCFSFYYHMYGKHIGKTLKIEYGYEH